MKVVRKKEVEEVIYFCDVCKKNKSIIECECCGKDICELDSVPVELNNCLYIFCVDCMKETSKSRKIINGLNEVVNVYKNRIERELGRINL